MSGTRTRFLAGSAVAAACATLFAAGAANASKVDQSPQQFASNYTFGDGAAGFALVSHGGPINPGVLVGFNPQPDPPGDGDHGLLIAPLNPSNPTLISPSLGASPASANRSATTP